MDINSKLAIVRILDQYGDTTGTGFVLTDDGLIATCAHVVASAGTGPSDTVRLVFHHTDDEASATVEPDGWRDPEAEDIAILRLDGSLPEGVKPVPLGSAAETANHSFETFGFPDANPDEGLWGKGEVLRETTLGGGRVLQLQSQEVTPGFSGAPIWDATIERVVGMVTAITNPDDYGRLGATAFATPTEVLIEIWPDLAQILLAPVLLSEAEMEAIVREAVLAYQLHLRDLTRPDIPAAPYKFLLPFGLQDQDIFFGRDEAIDDLYDTLFQARLTVLHARSGAGKSSLLNAGLGPRLVDRRYLPIFARTYNDPVSAIVNEIIKRGKPSPVRPWPALPLRDFLHLVVENMGRRVPELVIILDQFEEIFTRVHTSEERLIYAEALADCIEDDGLPLRFVFAIRGDFFSQLAEFEERLPYIFDNRFYLKPMKAGEVQAAITGPVREVDRAITYDETLLETLLEVLARDEMDLPELQILCTHLYDVAKRQGLSRIDPELYEEAGGAGGILGGYLEEALVKFPLEQRQVAWRVLTELVDSLGQRRIVTQREMHQQIDCPEELLKAVLTRLVQSRLVQRAEGDQYDLAHDYLTTTIKSQISQEDLALKEIRDLLQRESASWRTNRSLISRDRLEIIHEHRHSLTNLKPEEMELLCRSAVAHQFAVDTWALAAHRQGIDIWPILQPALTAQDFRLRVNVVAILPMVGEEALEALREALTDRVPLVRVHAIRALERLSIEAANQVLRDNLHYEVYIPPHGDEPGFYIDRYPVTNADYELFLMENPNYTPPAHWQKRTAPQGLRDHPVVGVSWTDAQAYATWAGKHLPTGREWQRAAGSQNGWRYPWGNQFTPGCCNTREAGVGMTTPVGMYSPGADSPYGVVDMAGNVWEWLADKAGAEGQYRQLRGGAWFYSNEFTRIDYNRFWRRPDHRQDVIGFRLCFSPSQVEEEHHDKYKPS